MLDMGCGYGYYSYIGKDFFKTVVAVDINDNSVKEATKRLGLIVEKGQIETYTSKHRFNLILCLLMVRRRHPGTRINMKTISNMVKLLSKKGILVVDVWVNLLNKIKRGFNIIKTVNTIELPNHIVKKQVRLHIGGKTDAKAE